MHPEEELDWQDCSEDSSCNFSGGTSSSQEDEEDELDWKYEIRKGGSLKEIDLDRGTRGWASPPGSFFQVRGSNYFAKKTKVPAGDWLFKPLGVDWLKSSAKLDHVLARSNNRVMRALEKAHSSGEGLKAYIFAVNLQVPGKEHHSAVFYYAVEEPISPGSLLHRFIYEEDDAFRNSRFKLINRIVKGPWIVRATVGNHAACLLGKALTCRYHRGPNYLEIDVDIGSSTVASYILHLALGYVNSVSVDMAFLVESQSEEELPERLMGAVRIAQIDMESAVHVEPGETGTGGSVQAGSGGGDSMIQSQEKNHVAALTCGAHHQHPGAGLQASNLSWKRLSSLLSHKGKAGKVDDEHTRCERGD